MHRLRLHSILLKDESLVLTRPRRRLSVIHFTRAPFRIAFRERFISLINLSHTPAKCGAFGGWNIQLIPRSDNRCLRFSSLQVFAAFFNSISAPRKLLPQSDRISFGVPRRAINCRKVLIKSPVSNEGVTSRCIARVTIQEKMHPHLFGVDRPCFINSGPNISIPTQVRGFVRSDSTFRKRSHLLMEFWSVPFPTHKTLVNYFSNQRPGLTDPESFT